MPIVIAIGIFGRLIATNAKKKLHNNITPSHSTRSEMKKKKNP